MINPPGCITVGCYSRPRRVRQSLHSEWLPFFFFIFLVQADVDTAKYVEVVLRELGVCDELLSVEPNCRQALLCVAILLQQVLALSPGAAPAGAVSRIASIFTRLRALDPYRESYYRKIYDQQSL
jgi:hypothetical protein